MGHVNVIEEDSLDWSKELTFVAPYLKEAPFEELRGDDVLHRATPTIELINSICTEPLYSTPFIPFTFDHPSHLHEFHVSPGDVRGSHPSFDLYCACLEEKHRKIMWDTFFDHTFDFFMTFNRF